MNNYSLPDLRTLVWVLYILLFPFYFLPSGGPQIADFLIVVLFILSLKQIISITQRSHVVKYLFQFLVYLTTINLFWSVLYLDVSIFKNVLFYVFNFIIFSFCVSKANCRSFWRYTLLAVSISLILQLILMPVGKVHYRPIMFFNNPNQLGYWSLLSMALIYILGFKMEKRYLYVIGYLGLGMFFGLLSLSRAAMASCALILVIGLINASFLRSAILVLLLSLVVSLYFPNLIQRIELAEKVSSRIDYVGGHDTAGGRGYDKVFLYPRYLLFGAGEGRYQRFNKAEYLGEIHSSLVNILFSYGIIGLILFLRFLYKSIQKSELKYWIILLPLFVYSITHMGLRFSLFWVVIAFISQSSINQFRYD